jgi:hypothetical protein
LTKRTRPGTAPTKKTIASIYRHHFSTAKARVALQITIYALERRIGPATVAFLRASYHTFVNLAPCAINQLEQRASRRFHRCELMWRDIRSTSHCRSTHNV